jgi:2-polyprenyl-3-methyl-5-hydroxy-6-metoxy-1,4-benzoquinol methylase
LSTLITAFDAVIGLPLDQLRPESSTPGLREERWKQEARFFDEQSQNLEIGLIDPLTLERYRSARRLRFNKEFRFHLLGDLRGKRVLDVGCGDGANTVLLAKLGAAMVVGIDISPGSIEVARTRARINGVSDRVEFVCAPLETAPLNSGAFDVIWGDAILHHLIADLDGVLKKLMDCARPGALLLFSEPVNISPTLRRIRFLIPVHTEVTPDERPLEPDEIGLLRSYVPDLRIQPFTLLGRLDRFVLRIYNYERSSAWRRSISSALAAADAVLLRVPGVDRLSGTAVLYGHARR